MRWHGCVPICRCSSSKLSRIRGHAPLLRSAPQGEWSTQLLQSDTGAKLDLRCGPKAGLSCTAPAVLLGDLDSCSCLACNPHVCSVSWLGGRMAFPEWTLGNIGLFFGNGEHSDAC